MDHSNVTDSGKFDNPTFADWQRQASILGLRQRGLELVGPCPSCGGKDRFSVALKGNRTVFNCRQCQGFVDILKAAGLAGEPRRINGTKHRPPPDMVHVYHDPKGEPYHRVYRRAAARTRTCGSKPVSRAGSTPTRSSTCPTWAKALS